MVEERLGLLQPEVVESHVHPCGAERHVGEDLRLTAGEQRRAVHARGDVDLGLDRPDLILRATVGALLVDRDPLDGWSTSRSRRTRPRDLAVTGGVGLLVTGVRRVLGEDGVLDRLDRLLAGELLGNAGGLVDRG